MPGTMKKTSGGKRDTLLTGAGMVVIQVTTYLTLLVIGRSLGAEGVGRYQLVFSTTLMLVLLTKAGLDEALAFVVPKAMVREPDKVFGLILYGIVVPVSVAVAIGAAVALLAEPVSILVTGSSQLTADFRYSILLLPSLTLITMLNGILRGLGRADVRAYVYYIGVGSLFLALVAGAHAVGGLAINDVYLARGASYVFGGVVSILLVFRMVKRGAMRLARSDIRSLHGFGGLLVFVNLFGYLVEFPMLDLVIVTRVASAKVAGGYYIAYKLAHLVSLGTAALAVVFGPRLSSAAAKDDRVAMVALYEESSLWMSRCGIFFGGGLLLIYSDVLSLFGKEFESGTRFLFIFMGAQVLIGLSGLNSVLLVATGRQRLEFKMTGIASLFVLVLTAVGGYCFGAEGVAWASASVTVGLATARYLAARRIFGLRTTPIPSLVVLLIAVGASLVGLGVRSILPPLHAVFALILVGGTYVGVFSALSYAVGYRLPGRRGARGGSAGG